MISNTTFNEEVRMVQHQYKTPNDERDSLLEETISSFIKEANWMQKKSENLVCRIKSNYDRTFKNQASAIKTIEKNLGRIAESIHGRGVGTLPSFTETNPRGLAHAITTRKAFEQMPKYAKFMKDLLSKKGKVSEASKIILNEQCSAVVLNKVPPKEKDPGGFTIPCIIGQSGITKALADLGASISLMPHSMFLRLNLCDLKPTRMYIELANKTTQFPKGIAENAVVKINKSVFPIDFVILDMEEEHRIPIILGRPFLATTHAMIDVFYKKISFEVRDEIITFDLEKSMRFPPSDEDTCHSADNIDLFVVDNIKEILPQNHDNSIEPILDHLLVVHEDCNNPSLFATNSIDEEKPTPKLIELPSHLEYAFLDDNHELPVIISSLLSDQEKRLLLEVLTKHKKALAWKISDIKGISPSFCTHKILMEENSKPTVQPQHSPWVSPIHVVPKKGGTTVITNKDNELIPTRTVTGWRVCIDYKKLNDATRKDHFPLPFIDQMLERLSGNEYYCFLDGFSRYFQIPLALEDQEKTTFTCPYGTFAYRRMPFGLCNAPATFHRCHDSNLHDICK
ncbi:putative nucleotidyltransferase, ribonuclease H [Tanacetum coccineum]